MAKHLNIVVTSCSNCPFNSWVANTFCVGDAKDGGATIKAGWYCSHPQNRGDNVIATHEEISEVKPTVDGMAIPREVLTEWLMNSWGDRVPEKCPLPDAAKGHNPTGKRALDLGT